MGRAGGTRSLAARTLVWMFLVGGATALLDAYVLRAGPALEDQVRLYVTVLSLADFAVAAIIRFMPWDRWDRSATLVPMAVAVVLHTAFALTGFMSEPVSVAFIVLGFIWVGYFQARRFIFVFVIPAALSYATPLWVADRTEEIGDLGVILSVCVGVGFVVNLLVERQKRAREQAEHRVHLLQVVADSGRRLSQLDPREIFDVGLEVVHHIGFGAALIETYDEHGVDRYVSTPSGAADRSWRVESSRLRKVLNATPSVLSEGEASQIELPMFDALPLQRIVAAPVRTSELLGAIVAGDDRDQVPDTAELEALELLANQIGQALTIARAFQSEQDQRRRHAEDATRDELTGLGNRRAVQALLHQIAPADAVVLLDLDHFKQVNDQHGHAKGDATLRELGAYLREFSRPQDHAARLGGEEFLVVLTQAGAETAAAVERLLAGWRKRPPATTMSAGFAVHLEGHSPAETMARADSALYEAKRAGRDRAMIATAVDRQHTG